MLQSNEAGRAVSAGEAVATIPVPSGDVRTSILRVGAQRRLATAIDVEADDWIIRHGEARDERGRRFVIRNGHHPPRTLVTGAGPVEGNQR